MYGRTTQPIGFGGGSAGPPPRDVLILLGVVFFTFIWQFFEATAGLHALLQLTPLVWHQGFVWQLGTYAFMGHGAPSFWFLLELLILFWFARDVYRYLGRRSFWQLLGWGIGIAAVVAVAVQLVLDLMGFGGPAPFILMQGQRTLLTIIIAAFATVYGHATIMLFFVLPLKARWFLGLEILFAFMGFLGTKDFAGFVGICAAVGFTYSSLSGRGPRKILREWRLRVERFVLEQRLKARRRKSGLRVVKGDRGGDGRSHQGPWIN